MTNPRPLTKDELNLMEFYSRCQLGMSPQRFRSKWAFTYEQIALICNRLGVDAPVTRGHLPFRTVRATFTAYSS